MKINEIFHTLQGEGPRTGISSIFLRLAGCNLRCIFCDTKYTWLFSEKTLNTLIQLIPENAISELGTVVYDKLDEIRELTNEQIVENIVNLPAKNIVITGGEPLLQKSDLIDLLSNKFFLDKTIEIETNGTIEPLDISEVDIQYNVSPKLRNSFNPEHRRLNYAALNQLVGKNSIFKFVISDSKDLGEVNQIVNRTKMPKNRVYLMPKASTKAELNSRSSEVFELAMSSGYSYSHRIHIQIFGSKRGI